MFHFNLRQRSATALALALAFFASQPLCAETSISVHGTPVRTVGYADLDLATPAGMAALDRRIAAAARNVCAAPVYSTASKAEYTCRSAAAAAAWAQLAPAEVASGR